MQLKFLKNMQKINKEQLAELNEWLSNFDLPRRNRKLSRDFSDGVLVATILKQFFPKFIEMHNYQPRNATTLKFSNWETLNRKVLRKIGLPQNKEFIKKLSESVPGAIELLLYKIMYFIKFERNQKTEEEEENTEFESDILTIKVTKKVGDGLVQVPQKMILYSLFEQSQEKNAYLNTIIKSLNQKIVHLENCLKLKVEKLQEFNNSFGKFSTKWQHITDDSSSKCSRNSSP